MLFWAHMMLLARTKQEEQSPNLPKKGTTNTQFFTTLHFDSRLTQYKIHHTHIHVPVPFTAPNRITLY